jgi:NAD(P)-dependent dehydrogenase (short-subunit alcohol dehydrogenase family)
MTTRGGIVITGASTGIGEACALALDRAGFQVFAGVRTMQAGEALKAKGSERLSHVLLDVTRPDQITRAAKHVARRLGERPLAGLMNNAGVTINGPLEMLPLDDLRRQLEINLIGQLAVTQAFLPMLRASKGRIVNTGSVSGLLAMPVLGPYCMSKFAMEAFSDSLRLELRQWGIEVVLLEPGMIATPIWEKGIRDGEETEEETTPEMLDLYGPLLDNTRKLAARAQREAKPVDLVARATVHAFTAKRPKPRYVMGGNAWSQKIISRLPTRWRDAVLVRMLKLPK